MLRPISPELVLFPDFEFQISLGTSDLPSGTEPMSVIPSQTKKLKTLKPETQKVPKLANAKRTSVVFMYSSALRSSEKMESQHYN